MTSHLKMAGHLICWKKSLFDLALKSDAAKPIEVWSTRGRLVIKYHLRVAVFAHEGERSDFK